MKMFVGKKSNESKRKYISLIKNLGIFSLSSLTTKVVSFLLIPLYTSVLNTEQFGNVDLISNLVLLLVPIFSLQIESAILRFGMDKDYNSESVLSIGVYIDVIGTVILFFILFILKSLHIVSINNHIFIYLIGAFLLNALNNGISFYLKAVNRVAVTALSGIISTFVLCVTNIIMLVWLKKGMEGYLFANILAQLCSVVFYYYRGSLKEKIHLKFFKKDIAEKMLSYSIPLIVNSIAWWINNASDKYILLLFTNMSIIGIYSIAYKIPNILVIFQSIFYNAWSISAISEFDKKDTDGFIGNVCTIYSALSLIVTSFILLINVPLAHFLYANDFFVAWKYTPFLLIGTYFNGLSYFIGCILTALKETKKISGSSILAALLNTVLNIILIPLCGAYGAAIATFVGYFFSCFMRIIWVRRQISIKVNWSIQYFAWLILLGQVVVGTIYEGTIIHIFFFITMCLLNRKAIYCIIKRYV